MKIGSIIKDALMLFAITLVLVTVLSAAKVGTQSAIDKANLEAQKKHLMKFAQDSAHLKISHLMS